MMEPGPELDNLMAERVMGWHTGVVPGPSVGLRGAWVDAETRSSYRAELGWSPSTDIAAALEVVEKMRRDDFDLAVVSEPEPDCADYEVQFLPATLRRHGVGSCENVVAAESLPYAICLAALRAKGIDTETVT